MRCCISMRENTQMKESDLKQKDKKKEERSTTVNRKVKMLTCWNQKNAFLENKVTNE